MISLERRDGRPLRIGHRGAAALAPENTLRAFRAAVAAGVALVEFDVLDLGGGEVVVAHSYDLREVSHGTLTGTIQGRTLEGARADCPELPSLDEALAFFVEEAPDVGIHLDVKSETAVPRLARSLGELGLVERSLATSFEHRALRRLAELEPGVRTGISFPADRAGVHGRHGTARVVRGALRAFRAVTPRLVPRLLARAGATAFVVHHALATPATVRVAHALGAAVVTWTVRDPRDLARVDDAGVDAVVVDDPTMFVSTLQT